MAPKPFPSQIRIGTDICEIARFKRLLQTHTGDSLQRWGSKVFNRLEWPLFLSKMEEYNRGGSVSFARWLAGRFAAKEAAIKAHTKRRLLRTHVSIIVPSIPSVVEHQITIKPIVLVSPSTGLVVMSELTAAKRGLKGVAMKYDNIASAKVPAEVTQKTKHFAQMVGLPIEEPLFIRHLLAKEEDRQIADLSISHDGDYATAVCLALDEEQEQIAGPIIDTGEGEPMHEPQWGDRGFGEPADTLSG